MITQKYKNKNIKKNYLLNSLFKSKNFYGESLNKINKTSLPFIYGIRHNFSIINLKYTIFFIKRTLNLLNFCLKKKKKILIIGNSLDLKFLLNNQFIKNNKNLILYKDQWINGLLTNNNNILNLFEKNKINLIILLKSEIKNDYLLKEINYSNIPLISFNNTDINLNYINYPILTNNKNLKSIFLLMYLIRKII